MTNDIFAENAWYFRNSLVRANYNDLKNGIHETTEYLELFLHNLLLNENHSLHNRTLYISGIFKEPEKVNSDVEKANIGAEKVNIDDVFTSKTAAHVRALREALGSQTAFGRLDFDEVNAMDMGFNVGKVFQERLASSMGLDKYQYIMEQVNSTNVATDIDFQRTFNGFYIVRRNESWRKSYYEYFEKIKNGTPTFESIITYLYESTGNIEPSFSSKMLATILPEKPIWDRYVVQNLNIQLTGATKEEKLKNAIILYADMEKWYADFLESEKGKECIREFDRVLTDYKGISSIKKIDSILWSIR